METKDYLYLIGLAVACCTFYWKLRSDTRIANYRETIAYLDRNDQDMRFHFESLRNVDLDGKQRETSAYIFLGKLELVSYLIDQSVFNANLVYELWWRYFDEPLRQNLLNSFVLIENTGDSEMYKFYIDRCKKWANRIESSQK